jgi:putative spermidine/putrescine transport system ATP-binding protein
VLARGTQSIAVRTDRIRLGQAGNGPQHAGQVSALEYLGAAVRVVVAAPDGTEAEALLADAAFHAAPVALGDGATLAWDPSDEHALAA